MLVFVFVLVPASALVFTLLLLIELPLLVVPALALSLALALVLELVTSIPCRVSDPRLLTQMRKIEIVDTELLVENVAPKLKFSCFRQQFLDQDTKNWSLPAWHYNLSGLCWATVIHRAVVFSEPQPSPALWWTVVTYIQESYFRSVFSYLIFIENFCDNFLLPDWRQWSTILVCPGLRGLLGRRTFRAKTRQVQAGWSS